MRRMVMHLALVAVLLMGASCSNRTLHWATASTGETLLGRESFAQGLVRTERAVLDDPSGATQYRIDLSIGHGLRDDPFLYGRQHVRYTNREKVDLREIYFRLLPNGAGGQLAVSNVTVDGQAVEPAYAAGNLALRVPLAAPLAPGQHVTMTMDFDLTVPRVAGGNYGLLGYLEETLVLDAFYPVIPAYDEEGWHAAPPPPNADASYNDASYYLVRVTAPRGLTLVASGIEVDRQRERDEQMAIFAAGPARDFYLAGSELYDVHLTDKVGEVRVNSYALSGQEAAARRVLRVATEAIQVFSREIGPFPYTEFDVVNSSLGALGIEYPGIVSIARSLYDAQGSQAEATLDSTVAHEVAHQWFYNAVGNDQPDEPWLDEALAQYLTMVYFRETAGEPAARSFRSSWDARWARVDREGIPIGLPAGEYSGREYGAIVYGRGPLFLEVLAGEMGQPAWEAFLRDYYQSYKWGIATTEGFKQLAEEHCQCDLTSLFQEWVYETP